ncbi:hypothetical protein V1478_005517 [Vespula squamosa]|uniref:Uncharacterized protein n=1 Tax=Vespula squamosa TaxID=30214 RepID=A0ABD2BEE5_VESSQ
MQDGFDNSTRELISSIPVYTFILRLSNVLLPQLPPDADLVKSLTVQCGPVFQEMCKMGLVTVERSRYLPLNKFNSINLSTILTSHLTSPISLRNEKVHDSSTNTLNRGMDVLIASWISRYQFLDITRCSSKEEIFSVVISFHFFDTVKESVEKS